MKLNPQYRQTSIRVLCICALLFSGISLLPSPLLSADNDGFTVRVKTVSDNKLTVTYELGNYSVTEYIKHGNTFSRIMLGGAERTNVAGKPNLPFVSTLFGIPVSGDFNVALQSIKTTKKIMPFVEPVDPIALGPVLAGRFNLDGFYKQDTYYPASHYEVTSPGFFRDHRIGAILFFPFRYNPQTRTLSIITQATFIISFASQAREPGNIRIPEKDNKAESLFSNLVSNYEQCKRWLKPHPFPQIPEPRQADTLFKIITGKEGLHHIAYTDLINAGINPSTINPREIHITHRGFEIPIYVKGEEDSVFNMQDYIDFFALSIHGETTFFNPYTFKNVYWLSFGDSLGKRMVEEDGTPDSISHFPLSSFRDTIHFEKDSIFVRLSVITADSTDMWFWDRLYGPDTQYIDVFVPSPDTLAPFDLMVNLHGFTTTHAGHRVQVLFNDSFLADSSWHGQAPYTLSIEGISGNILHHGSNTITLILPAPVDSVDGLFSNWVEISYDHLLKSSNNTITFNIPEDMQDTTYEFIIDNFDFADVEIYKQNVSKIINFKREIYQEQGNTKYRFIFQDKDITSLMRFTIVPIWEKYQPERIEKVHLRDLHATTHNAEFLIITSDALLASAETYALWKETHGFDCMVVTIDEIYNEFNHGIDSPEAIKQFISYAYDYYNQPPLYCLLFGDGTFDYRNIRGHSGNFVPVHLSMYWGLWGAVADDGYFARVSGDDLLPDIFIGRFPIRSDDEFDGIFEKAKMYVDYQNLDEWKRNLVFVADSGTAGYNSYFDMDHIIADYLPPAYDANRCYHPRKMREDFLKEMDEGAVFVNFLSHGGGDILCGGGFLISKDVFRMTNLDRMPFWTAFSCVNGFFDEPHPDSISIGETVFLAPNGGGIGYYGPGSLTYGGHNYLLSRRIYEGFFNHNLLHFGQFLAYGEIAYYSSYGNQYQLYTYNLLGDPGIELSLPDTTHIDLSISVSSISAGDTLTVQGVLLSSLQGEAVVTYYTVRDTALISFQKISYL
ncbi:MAG: hypothetical protein E3J78_08100 [Candidatus Cloacimonadota bacterium]|nr:MAG: hypothetical protein E3J78_08100 [Candidatus Cloacimonadota bacterium]